MPNDDLNDVKIKVNHSRGRNKSINKTADAVNFSSNPYSNSK